MEGGLSDRPAGGDAGARVTPLVRDRTGPLGFARALADLSGEAMLLASTGGMLVHANPAARALFGLAEDEVEGHDLRVLAAEACESVEIAP